MSTFKKTKVVMLPTNEKAVIGFLTQKGKERGNLVHFDSPMPNILDSENQHLYFLSDEEIKEGDWILHKNTIYQVRMNKGLYLTLEGLQHIDVRSDLCKKIIATTDKSLSFTWRDNKNDLHIYHLPQPSQSFIEKFVEEYNKGNVITEVLVEYETITKRYGSCSIGEGVTMNVEQLKVSKDNTITIRKVKDSWSREEVKQLFDKMFALTDFVDINVLKVDFDKWIEENL